VTSLSSPDWSHHVVGESAGAEPPPPGIDLESFRAIMGSLASGVSIISSLGSTEAPLGMTCSAVCSVSADPPLLLSCVRTPSVTLDAIQACRRFTVNFLDITGRDLSELFASHAPDKFAKVPWRPSVLVGMPVIEQSIAVAECLLRETFRAGDHMIVLGRIVGGEVAPDRFPLAYWRGNYVRVLRMSRH
jgi:flavin reductase (NADH)